MTEMLSSDPFFKASFAICLLILRVFWSFDYTKHISITLWSSTVSQTPSQAMIKYLLLGFITCRTICGYEITPYSLKAWSPMARVMARRFPSFPLTLSLLMSPPPSNMRLLSSGSLALWSLDSLWQVLEVVVLLHRTARLSPTFAR